MIGSNEAVTTYEHTIYLSRDNCVHSLGMGLAQFKFPLPDSLNLNSGMNDYSASLSYFELTDSHVWLPFRFRGKFGTRHGETFAWNGPSVNIIIYCNSIQDIIDKLNPLLAVYSVKLESFVKGTTIAQLV